MVNIVYKDFFKHLRYFISASYKEILFTVNIAIMKDHCVRELVVLLIAGLEHGTRVQGFVNCKAPRSKKAFNSVQFGRTLEQSGAVIYYPKISICMHAKTWLFDQKTLIVGSHNLSGSSDKKNMETSVIITEQGAIDRYLDMFNYFKTRC